MEHASSVQATTARRVRTDLTPAAHFFIHIFLVSPHLIVLLRRETNWMLFEFFILPSHFCTRYEPLFLTSHLTCTFNREKMSGFFGVFSLLLFITWHFSKIIPKMWNLGVYQKQNSATLFIWILSAVEQECQDQMTRSL